jgi:hypothetical protein
VRRLRAAVLALGLTLLAAAPAAACPVCFDAEDEARHAYLATTAVLSLLPLALAGGAALWFRRRVRQRDLDPRSGV